MEVATESFFLHFLPSMRDVKEQNSSRTSVRFIMLSQTEFELCGDWLRDVGVHCGLVVYHLCG